jgi:hypothetical protein
VDVLIFGLVVALIAIVAIDMLRVRGPVTDEPPTSIDERAIITQKISVDLTRRR